MRKSPYEKMHDEAVRAKRARNAGQTKVEWNEATITHALADAQIGDRFSALSSRDAIRFLEIGNDYGMAIAITLRADGFAATFEGRN